MDTILQTIQEFAAGVGTFFSGFSLPGLDSALGTLSAAGTLALHVLTAVLALLIFLRCASSLLRGRTEDET